MTVARPWEDDATDPEPESLADLKENGDHDDRREAWAEILSCADPKQVRLSLSDILSQFLEPDAASSMDQVINDALDDLLDSCLRSCHGCSNLTTSIDFCPPCTEQVRERSRRGRNVSCL